ncbi:MAG: LLM class flavin-dependent oxidoreductase [Myxococcales bacterium]|nr:LLM class flavin-dependent oxidoreductase [Myxococcales bacterium]
MELSQRGVFAFTEGLSAAEVGDAARRLESLGYSALWYPEAAGREPFVTAALVLAATERLVAATGIVNIYGRDPMVCAMGQQTLNEMSGGRFLLGLGVSHGPFVEGRGHKYGKPLATMRSYVEAIGECHKAISVTKNLAATGIEEQPISRSTGNTVRLADLGEMPIVLAALGPKMTQLSADISKGSHPYNTVPEHTARARELLGKDAWLCPMVRVCLTPDASRAREIGRQLLGLYLQLPNYTNMLRGSGFGDADFQGGGSDRLVDALMAWGSTSDLEARVREHLDAGASHIAIQAIDPKDPARPGWEALEALAPN